MEAVLQDVGRVVVGRPQQTRSAVRAGSFGEIAGKAVIHHGSGNGRESVEMAEQGAAREISLEIQEQGLIDRHAWAVARGVADRCTSARATCDRVGVMTSTVAYEPDSDPAAILEGHG